MNTPESAPATAPRNPADQPPPFIIWLLTFLGLAMALTLQLNEGLPARWQYLPWPLLSLGVYLWAALNLGAVMRRWFLGADSAGKLGLELLLGLLAIGMLTMALGSVGLLYSWLVWPLLAASLALRGPRRLWQEARLGWAELTAEQNMDAFAIALALLTLGGASLALLGAMTPPAGMDALTYHLALPDQHLIRHSLVPPSSGGYQLYWQQFEMALAPLLMLDQNGMAANLLNFVVFLSLLVVAWRLGFIWGRHRGAWIAATVVAVSPLCLRMVWLTKNDLFCMALVGHAWLHLAMTGRERAPLIGFLAGGAMAVRPSAVFAVLPLCLLLFGPEFKSLLPRPERRRRRRRFNEKATPEEEEPPPDRSAFFSDRNLRLALVGLGLLPAFWLLRTWFWSGAILPGGFYAARAQESLAWQAPVSVWDNPILHFMHLAFMRIGHLGLAFERDYSDGLDGPLGPLFLPLIVVTFYRRELFAGCFPPRRLALAGACGAALWVFFGRGQARFLLPLFLPWACAGSGLLRHSGRELRAVTVTAALMSLLASVALAERYDQILAWHAQVHPVPWHMRQFLDTWALQKVADDKLPPDANVLAVGEAELFYLHRRADYDGYWEPSRALAWAAASADSDSLRRDLRARGFTHVLYNPTILRRLVKSGRMPPWPEGAERRLEELLAACPVVAADSKTAAAVYALTPADPAARQESTTEHTEHTETSARNELSIPDSPAGR